MDLDRSRTMMYGPALADGDSIAILSCAGLHIEGSINLYRAGAGFCCPHEGVLRLRGTPPARNIIHIQHDCLGASCSRFVLIIANGKRA